MDWWKQNAPAIPNRAMAAAKALLVQPSSAASERVFSKVKVYFEEQQHSLQDYLGSFSYAAV